MSTTNPKPKAYKSAFQKIGQKTKSGKGVSFPLSHAILERTSSENETTTDKVAERQYLNIDNKKKLAGQIAAQMNVTPKSIFKRVPGTKSPATTDGTYIYPEEEADMYNQLVDKTTLYQPDREYVENEDSGNVNLRSLRVEKTPGTPKVIALEMWNSQPNIVTTDGIDRKHSGGVNNNRKTKSKRKANRKTKKKTKRKAKGNTKKRR